MLGSKTSLNKLQNIVITSNIFSDHSGMKLEINNRKNFEKLANVEINQHDPEQTIDLRRH